MLSGERVVMLRAVALRLESGAITSTSTPSSSRSARRAACRPGAEMPSSLVRRMRTRSILGVADGLQVRPGCRRGVARLGPGRAGQQLDEALGRAPARSHFQHGADEDPDHAAHEGVGADAEGEDGAGLRLPGSGEDLALEADAFMRS